MRSGSPVWSRSVPLRSRIREDAVAYDITSARSLVLSIVGLSPFWLLVTHRIAHALRLRHVPGLPTLLLSVGRVVWGAEVWPEATIGRQVKFAHTAGIVIGSATVVGDRTTIFHGVTLGGANVSSVDGSRNHPILGSDVTVYPGAVIVGGVTIGDGARIAANAVVMENVPAGATVAGVPARIVATRGNRTAEDISSRAVEPDEP
jgi:serine O-acetyltransferase